MKNKILKWQRLTHKITEQWIAEYFELSEEDSASGIDYFWVGDEVGGILNYGDYFFNFSDILTCYKLKITIEQLINWYDFCLENQSVHISLAKYILSPQERKEAEEKHLAELKERVESAEKEFKKAIEDYEHNTTH